jgi:hypothetical protein
VSSYFDNFKSIGSCQKIIKQGTPIGAMPR